MELTGKIKKIDETKTFGAKGFRKREMAITTPDQYPQNILIEFVQDNCDLLDNFKVGDDVTIQINILGRIWTNPEGVDVYFNGIQGWRIASADGSQAPTNNASSKKATSPVDDAEPDDLPF